MKSDTMKIVSTSSRRVESPPFFLIISMSKIFKQLSKPD